MLSGLISLDLWFDVQMLGPEFPVNNMELWIVSIPFCINCWRWWHYEWYGEKLLPYIITLSPIKDCTCSFRGEKRNLSFKINCRTIQGTQKFFFFVNIDFIVIGSQSNAASLICTANRFRRNVEFHNEFYMRKNLPIYKVWWIKIRPNFIKKKIILSFQLNSYIY